MKKNILNTMEKCGINNESILRTWSEMVNIESYSYNVNGVYKICDYIKEQLDNLGLITRIINYENAGPTLIGEYGEGDKGEGFILAGHMDTVFKDGFILNNPFKVEGNKVFGPGVLDMKGGINLIFQIIKILKELKYNKPIKVIISGDEECGHSKSNVGKLIERESEGYKFAFNMETGMVNNDITVARKGKIDCTIKIKGLSAHAGNDFSDGISAIYEMAHKIIKIQQLNKNQKNITYNVGIVNGGTMSNSVPDYAEMKLDIRFFNNDDVKNITREINNIVDLNNIKGVKSELIVESVFPPFESKYNHSLYELVKSVSIENGFGLTNATTLGGCSDASYITIGKVPCLCSMGVKGKWNHTDREYALIDSAIERIELIVKSILKIEKRGL